MKTSDEIMRRLEARAAQLASQRYFYSAFVMLRGYNGALAKETRPARLKSAEKYLALARNERLAFAGNIAG